MINRSWTLAIIALMGIFSFEFHATAAPDARARRLFDVKIREATTAFEREDYAAATRKLDDASAIIPDDPATLNLRGAVLYKEKKYEAALAAFQDLIARDTNSYPGYFNTAEVLFAQKKYDEALTGFQRILDARPNDETCMFRIVLVLALKGDLDDARTRARRIPNPGQTAAYYFANGALEYIAGNAKAGDQWIRDSEMFFPPEESKALRNVLVEHDLVKK